MNNSAALQLAELGVIDVEASVPVGVTRDRDDIVVLRCPRSGVIFLETSEHIQRGYYETEYDPREDTVVREKKVKRAPLNDTRRRAEQLRPLVRGRRWLDFGTGWGHVVIELNTEAEIAVGLDPSEVKQDFMRTHQVQTVAGLDDLRAGMLFDVISLFHVLEHLPDPIGELVALGDRMDKGAVLVIEVPHARDALLTIYRSDAFAAFTFWSQHLVLHTRASLAAALRAAGFMDLSIVGFQRYPLANHLHWLSRGAPAGHMLWPELSVGSLDEAYGAALAAVDSTDTLIAHARA
jgi:2-polyprenyl-3-methyl-5-hydroxy-6-metoxy-1,4-benzoquinol methylase